MAARFSCDPQSAGQVAGELTQVRTDMATMGQSLDGYGPATGSAKVQEALHDFVADSSDNRKHMSELLDRAAGLLRGLAEGTTSVDRSLADSLTPQQGAPVTAAGGTAR